jgi:hypothetical protein
MGILLFSQFSLIANIALGGFLGNQFIVVRCGGLLQSARLRVPGKRDDL